MLESLLAVPPFTNHNTRPINWIILAGEFLCLHGDLWPYIFLIAAGLIEIRKESPEGCSLLVASLQPRELFWGVTFFDEQAGMPVMLAATLA